LTCSKWEIYLLKKEIMSMEKAFGEMIIFKAMQTGAAFSLAFYLIQILFLQQ